MLLELFNWLAAINPDFNVFIYITLRAILGALTALAISLILGPSFIRRLVRKQVGQPIRKLGPESHFSKAGTPTMGGALILFSIVVSTLLWSDLGNRYIWTVLLVTLSFGVIGWIDDYKKLVLQDSAGLAARWKYLLQSLIGFAAAIYLYSTTQSPAETGLIVPFFKDVVIPLGLGYVFLTYFFIVGYSNAVNLTDGLDGLAIMPAVFLAVALGIFAYVTGHSVFSDYLAIPYIAGAGELTVFCGALEVPASIADRSRRRHLPVFDHPVAGRNRPDRAVFQGCRHSAGAGLRLCHLLFHRRLLQRRQPHRRARRPGDHAGRVPRRGAGHFCLRDRPLGVFGLPGHSLYRRRR